MSPISVLIAGELTPSSSIYVKRDSAATTVERANPMWLVIWIDVVGKRVGGDVVILAVVLE